jgi:hypothetical protein
VLTPEQIQKIADTMFPMLDSLNARILRDMIKRLAARIGRGEDNMLTATDEWQAQVYQEAGGLLEDVQREIQQFLQASDEEMARIFEDAAIKSLDADNRVYVQAGDRARSISPAMLRVLTDTYQRTKGTVHNFTRTTATETQKEFIRLLDEAHLRVMSGAGAYTQAVSDAMRELCETQTRVLYPSGHVDTIETAVLRAVRTGTAQAAGNMSLTDMEERGWDLIRVSAHIGARYGDGGENPGNHFWWQGKLYSKSGNDKRYPPFVATTGYGTGDGLCGWNCRHSFGPGDLNHNPFKDFDAEENKKAYDLSQRQREMERRIRHTKTKLIGLREGIEATEDAGVKASLETEYAKTVMLLNQRNMAYRVFCKENNLKPLSERIEVAKWTRADTKKSIMTVEESYRNGISGTGADIGGPKTLAKRNELLYNNKQESELFDLYLAQVKRGTVSPMCTFENYKNQHALVDEKVVGITTSNGILITSQSKHFIERVIGTMDDPKNHLPRSGVPVDAILDALKNPLKINAPRTDAEGLKSQKFIGKHGTVVINPDTGVLIQCNPTDSDLVRRLMKNGS